MKQWAAASCLFAFLVCLHMALDCSAMNDWRYAMLELLLEHWRQMKMGARHELS